MILCRTPDWGSLYPSMVTRVSMFEKDVELEYRGGDSLPTFTFIESRWISLTTNNQHGAKGGDNITFYASGLDPTARDIYHCVFHDESAHIMVNSSFATASSPTEVICQVPSWGEYYKAANVTVKLYEENELVEHHYKDQLILVDQTNPEGLILDGYEHTDYSLFWEFYEVFDSVSIYPEENIKGGSAFGNENVTLKVYGFDIYHDYGLRWQAPNATMLSHLARPSSTNSITFISVPWGNFFSFGEVKLTILVDPITSASILSSSGYVDETLTNNVVDVSSDPDIETYRQILGSGRVARAPLSTPQPITYTFKHGWFALNTTEAGAIGGDFLGIYGAGFDIVTKEDSTHKYLCLFAGEVEGAPINVSTLASNVVQDDNIPSSTIVQSNQVRKLRCRIPPGGRYFAQINVTVSLWYGAYNNETFSDLYRVRLNGLLSPSPLNDQDVNDYAIVNEYDRTIYPGFGFLTPNPIVDRITFLCCYAITISIHDMIPDDMLQLETSTINIVDWNLPFFDESIAVTHKNASEYPNVKITMVDISDNHPSEDFISDLKAFIRPFGYCKPTFSPTSAPATPSQLPSPEPTATIYPTITNTTLSPSAFPSTLTTQAPTELSLYPTEVPTMTRYPSMLPSPVPTTEDFNRTNQSYVEEWQCIENASAISFTVPKGVGRDKYFYIYLQKEFPLLEFRSENSFNYTLPVVTSYTGTVPGNSEQPSSTSDVTITLTGEHFGMENYGPVAGIGDYECDSTTYINDTTLECVGVPSGIGAVNDIWVLVRRRYSPSNGLYAYDAPVIDRATTYEGTTTFDTRGGDILTIYGLNFGENDITINGLEPNRNVSVDGVWCDTVFESSDTKILCGTPEYYGKMLDVVVYIQGQDSGDSGPSIVTYSPPEVTTVTPAVNADQGGGNQLIIFGEYLGPLGYDGVEVWIGPYFHSQEVDKETDEWAGPCTDVLIRIAHVMIQCVYPPGIGFEMPVIVTVGNQSSSELTDGQLSYVDLTGQRTVNATMEISVNTDPYFNTTVQYFNNTNTSMTYCSHDFDSDGKPTNLNPDGFPKCGLYHGSVFHEFQWGVGAWVDSIGDSISLEEDDMFVLEDSIVLCDADQRETYGLLHRKKKNNKITKVGESYAYTIRSDSKIFKNCTNPDAYQQVTVTVLASGAYEASKIKLWWTNISQYDSALDYVNKYLCAGCASSTVWDDDWKDTCDHCAITKIDTIEVGERPEVYCEGGQELLSGVSGDYSCGICPPDKYKVKKDLESCMNCPVGSVCALPGTKLPLTAPGFWRKNFMSDFRDTKYDILKSPYDSRKIYDFGPNAERDGSEDGYAFHGCPAELACLGGENSTCLTGHLQGSPVCAVCCSEALWPEICNDDVLYNQPEREKGMEGSGGSWYIVTQGYCLRCEQTGYGVFVMMVSAIAAGVLCLFIFTIWYMKVDLTSDISDDGNTNKDEQRSASRATKMKMLMSYMQVFGGNEEFDIPWPKSFTRMMSAVNSIVAANPLSLPVLNVNCVGEPRDYYYTYYFAITIPICMVFYFIGCFKIGYSYLNGRGMRIGVLPWQLRRKMATFTDSAFQITFWMILIIYPNVSRVVLEMLNCKDLDGSGERNQESSLESYLVADLTIDCTDEKYLFHLIFIFVPSLIIYPFGVPMGFFFLLNQAKLSVTWTKRLSFMFTTYKEEYWWFECYDLLRKLFVTGVIIFVMPGTIVQIAVACMMHCVGCMVHFYTYPYESSADNSLGSIALSQILLTTFLGLLLKVDAGGEQGADPAAGEFLIILLVGSNLFVLLVLGPLAMIIVFQDLLSEQRWFRRCVVRCGCEALMLVDMDYTEEEESDSEVQTDSDDDYLFQLLKLTTTEEEVTSSSSEEEESTESSEIVTSSDSSRSDSMSSATWSSDGSSDSLTSLSKSTESNFGPTKRCIIVKYNGNLYRVNLDLAAPMLLKPHQREEDMIDPGIEVPLDKDMVFAPGGRRNSGSTRGPLIDEDAIQEAERIRQALIAANQAKQISLHNRFGNNQRPKLASHLLKDHEQLHAGLNGKGGSSLTGKIPVHLRVFGAGGNAATLARQRKRREQAGGLGGTPSQASFHSQSSSKFAQEATKQATVPLNNMFGRKPPRAMLRPMRNLASSVKYRSGDQGSGNKKVPLNAMMGGAGQRKNNQNRQSLASATVKLRTFDSKNRSIGSRSNSSQESLKNMPMFNRPYQPSPPPTTSSMTPPPPSDDAIMSPPLPNNQSLDKNNNVGPKATTNVDTGKLPILNKKLPILPSKSGKSGKGGNSSLSNASIGRRPPVQLRGFGDQISPPKLQPMSRNKEERENDILGEEGDRQKRQSSSSTLPPDFYDINLNEIESGRLHQPSNMSLNKMKSKLGSKVVTQLRSPNISKDSTYSQTGPRLKFSKDKVNALKSSSRNSPVPLRPMGSSKGSSKNKALNADSQMPPIQSAVPVQIATPISDATPLLSTTSTASKSTTSSQQEGKSITKPKLGTSKLMAKPRLVGAGKGTTKLPPTISPFSGNFPQRQPNNANEVIPQQSVTSAGVDGFPRPFVPSASTSTLPAIPPTPTVLSTSQQQTTAPITGKLPRASRAPRANRTSFASTDSVQQVQVTSQQVESTPPTTTSSSTFGPSLSSLGTARAPRAPRANKSRNLKK